MYKEVEAEEVRPVFGTQIDKTTSSSKFDSGIGGVSLDHDLNTSAASSSATSSSLFSKCDISEDKIEENCSKQFKSAYNYKLHVKHHNKQFSFICQICGKGFMNRNHQESHANTHLKEKPHKCNGCSKRFLTPSNLCRHMQSCTNVSKVHECVVCGKKFQTVENVLRHQKHAHT